MSKPSHQIRDDEIYAKRMRGALRADLALEYNLSEARISEIVRQVSMSMPERDRSELLARSVEQLDFITEKVMSLYNVSPSPVFVGKDGDIARDENDAVVRDYSLRRAALDQLMRLNQVYAKRLGLDAPAEASVKATVHYTIEGIDPGDLT